MTCYMGMSSSCLPRTTRSVLACKPMSLLIAYDVLPLARVSQYLPKRVVPIKMVWTS